MARGEETCHKFRVKKREYYLGTENDPFELWTERQWKQFLDQITEDYIEQGSSREDSEPSDDEFAECTGKDLFVNKGVMYYGDRRGKRGRPIESVSELPIDDKMLFRNGSHVLSEGAKSFVAKLSKFVRKTRFEVAEGSFHCVTQVCSDRRDAKRVSIKGDRPFPYIPSKDEGLFQVIKTVTLSGREVKLAKFIGPSSEDDSSSEDGSCLGDGSSEGGSSKARDMKGELIYLASCDIYPDRMWDSNNVSVQVSNSGRISVMGSGWDLCFSATGFVSTIDHRSAVSLPVDHGEPLVIAIQGSTQHATHHQRNIVHRLLPAEGGIVDLEDFEGTEAIVLREVDVEDDVGFQRGLEKLSRAVRRGGMSGRFTSTRELSEALRMKNSELILALRMNICEDIVKDAGCFQCRTKTSWYGVIELRKGAYVEEGGGLFCVYGGGMLVARTSTVGWVRLRRCGNMYDIERESFSARQVGDGDFELLPTGTALETGTYIGGGACGDECIKRAVEIDSDESSSDPRG